MPNLKFIRTHENPDKKSVLLGQEIPLDQIIGLVLKPKDDGLRDLVYFAGPFQKAEVVAEILPPEIKLVEIAKPKTVGDALQNLRDLLG